MQWDHWHTDRGRVFWNRMGLLHLRLSMGKLYQKVSILDKYIKCKHVSILFTILDISKSHIHKSLFTCKIIKWYIENLINISNSFSYRWVNYIKRYRYWTNLSNARDIVFTIYYKVYQSPIIASEIRGELFEPGRVDTLVLLGLSIS